MLLGSFAENISIYLDNLSWYLIITICFTALSVLLTICLQLQIPVLDGFENLISFLFTRNPIIEQASKNELEVAASAEYNLTTEDTTKLKGNQETHEIMLLKESELLEHLQFSSGDDELNTSQTKTNLQNDIFTKINSKMTPEEHNEEEEIVNEQLAKIFALLKEQEEKFMVNDMGDLKEQLSLYK